MIKVKILGMGCTKCKMMESNIQKAGEQSGVELSIEKSRKPSDYNKYKARMMPALIVDEKLVSSGSVPDVNQLTELFNSIVK